MRELVQTDILPSIVSYLEEIGQSKISQKLSNTFDIDNVKRNKFTKKNIQEIFQFYIENHPKLQKLFPDEVEEPKKKKKRKVSVESRKQSEDVKRKTSVEKTSRKVSEQESLKRKNSQEIKIKNEVKQVKYDNEQTSGAKFFQKIDYSRVDQTDSRLLDNTFEAKERYGYGDDFGKLGNQILGPTRGKDFRKGKNKLKNKGFAGGDFKINVNQVNGIKL